MLLTRLITADRDGEGGGGAKGGREEVSLMSTEKMLNGGITKLLSSFSAYHLPPPEQEELHLITDLQAHAACVRSPRSNFSAVDVSYGHI